VPPAQVRAAPRAQQHLRRLADPLDEDRSGQVTTTTSTAAAAAASAAATTTTTTTSTSTTTTTTTTTSTTTATAAATTATTSTTTSTTTTATRFHWRNHKNIPFCAKWVNPAKCDELGLNTNTEAAESVRASVAICTVTLSPNPSHYLLCAELCVACAVEAHLPQYERGPVCLCYGTDDGAAQ
jgi:hypothetical protein